MSRTIMIMGGGTGGHILGSSITRAERALAFPEDVAADELVGAVHE